MRVVLQRVTNAMVEVDEEVCGSIDNGLVLLVGISESDTVLDIDYLVSKIINMRIFEDDNGKLNKSLIDNGYSILSISQFTLYAKTEKGNRPSFTEAANRDLALQLYNLFNDKIMDKGIKVEKGVFGANMQVSLTNDGPVTIVIDSKAK